ncbi:predicted protein [Naegleria gruberi]|uniref:Predicted protein n=1 Tax=Naegleria gruberi TaxID=5762 RepID=D2UZH2_NAEGR|nr:uncharacterized protein NAEGRDRAFT_45476 [Naegleria gruberi]EFC50150.1 predicted protein [Naegleria gruberi]|eukprot:XP_002682894.1 predicted protein [Naegleria gruberi strain NEG-M]
MTYDIPRSSATANLREVAIFHNYIFKRKFVDTELLKIIRDSLEVYHCSYVDQVISQCKTKTLQQAIADLVQQIFTIYDRDIGNIVKGLKREEAWTIFKTKSVPAFITDRALCGYGINSSMFFVFNKETREYELRDSLLSSYITFRWDSFFNSRRANDVEYHFHLLLPFLFLGESTKLIQSPLETLGIANHDHKQFAKLEIKKMIQGRTSKNSKQNVREEYLNYEEVTSTPSRSLEVEKDVSRQLVIQEGSNFQYSSNLNNDLLNDYLNDDLLEQIERQYLSKNTKKNRSPISITKSNHTIPSSQDFNILSLLHHYKEPSLNEQAILNSEAHDNISTNNTTSSMNTMVIENIIKSLINSTGSNCHKVISERYIKDVVNINKSNQMWITNISKTDMSSCTLELQSISNTLTRKKIGPCEKVVRITVYSSHNGKPKKCVISTSHHPNFGFKTINDNWIFENSIDLLPDTFIIPEQNILRFLQLTFIGSHTFANTHRIKHVSVTLEDAIVSNKDYLDRVRMEITGIPVEESASFNTTSHQHSNKVIAQTKSSLSPQKDSNLNLKTIKSGPEKKEIITKQIVQALDEENIELDEANPLLKILNTNTGMETPLDREEPSNIDSLKEDIQDSDDFFDEEELEKELMQIEMKLNEKKKILDNINSPIKTIHLSPTKQRSPNRVLEDVTRSTPSPIQVKTRADNNQQLKEARPSVTFDIPASTKNNTPPRTSPVKKSVTPKQEPKSNVPSSKPIVIDFNPSFQMQPKQEFNPSSTLNRKPNQTLLSFISQLQKYAPPKPASTSTQNQTPQTKYSPPTTNNLILEKLNMQKKLKEELEHLKHLNDVNARKEYTSPHVYTSPTKNVPFLCKSTHVEEYNNDSDDSSSDITLTVEEDDHPISPIGKEESALVVDFSPPHNHTLLPNRNPPSPPFRIVNDLSPKQENDFLHDYDENSPQQYRNDPSPSQEEDLLYLTNDFVGEEEDEQQRSPFKDFIVEESEIEDHDLLTTLEDEVIEQFNRGSQPNSQNNSINIEIPKEMEDFLIEDNEQPLIEIPEIVAVIEENQPKPTPPTYSVVDVPEDEFSIIQSFLDTTLSSENSFAFTPTKSPTTRLSSPLSLSIPNHNELDSPRVELLTPSKILLKGEPSRLLRVKKGINCYLHDYDIKKKKYKVHKRILKLDRDSKCLSISASGKSLFKKTTKIELSKDIKWIVYGPYSQAFKNTNIIYRPFKCFSIATQNKIYSFEVMSEGIRDVDDTILGIQFLIQDRIKSFNRPIYTKCNLIVKRYLLKKYLTFTNTSITVDDEMSSITSDSIASPRMMRSKSFKF